MSPWERIDDDHSSGYNYVVSVYSNVRSVQVYSLQSQCRMRFNVLEKLARVRFRVTKVVTPFLTSVGYRGAVLDRPDSFLVPELSLRSPVPAVEPAVLPCFRCWPPRGDGPVHRFSRPFASCVRS